MNIAFVVLSYMSKRKPPTNGIRINSGANQLFCGLFAFHHRQKTRQIKYSKIEERNLNLDN